jgi:hypothetical protein
MNQMKFKYCIKIIFYLLLSIINPSKATELNYYKLVELRGYLTQEAGVDCCTDGKEEEIFYPVIKLKNPVNVFSANPLKPEIDEPTELDVTIIQLALNNKTWREFKKYKGKIARVLCLPYHAINGHHMTPVLCEVRSIRNP